MTAGEVWGWVFPALVVFGVAAALVAAGVWFARRARRSPKAVAAADAERAQAGIALVRLDDAVGELDLEVGLSGALYEGAASPALRRARMTAQHARDDAFSQYRDLDDAPTPAQRAVAAQRIRTRAEAATAAVARARTEHADWVQQHVSAAEQVDAARTRLAALRVEVGDPSALIAELSQRYDAVEWERGAAASTTAIEALDAADQLLAEASERASDPTRTAVPVLAAAEREVRRAREAARRLDETYRLVTDAGAAVGEELEAARVAVRQALTTREGLEPADAERLGGELRTISERLAALEASAPRRPTATVDELARLRDRLDLALGDARTAQQRLRGARSALPGALATARAAIAHAEPKASRAGADARVRLTSAQRELAAARGTQDPVEALDAARRAARHAEDAAALADYDRDRPGRR